MTITFIFWGSFNSGAERDAIRCSVSRAECPVIVVSEQPHGVRGAEWMPIQSFHKSNEKYRAIMARIGPHKWKAPTLARWIVLRELVERRPELTWPIASLDWDVLLFSPFAKAYAPFMGCDWTISSYVEKGKLERSAAYVINHQAVVEAYCTLIDSWLSDNVPWDEDRQDMKAFSQLQDGYQGCTVGNLFEEHDGGIWDHNIFVCDNDRFIPDNTGYKLLEFSKGTPYFFKKGLHGNDPVVAHTTHCWGNYKTRTAELLKRAGIT